MLKRSIESVDVCEKKARFDVLVRVATQVVVPNPVELVRCWNDISTARKCVIAKDLFLALRDFQPEIARECWTSGVRIFSEAGRMPMVAIFASKQPVNNKKDLQVATERYCNSTANSTLKTVITCLIATHYAEISIVNKEQVRRHTLFGKKPRVCPPEVAATFIKDILNTPGLRPSKAWVMETGGPFDGMTYGSVYVPSKIEKFARQWIRPEGRATAKMVHVYNDRVFVHDIEYWGEGELDAYFRQFKATCAAIAAVLHAEYQ